MNFTMHHLFLRLYLFLLAPLLLVGCRDRDEIKVYRLAKESPSEISPSLLPSSLNRGTIAWHSPPQWEEQEASGMRTGSFSAKGKSGREVDISLIFLAGKAGGDLPNVNRWRQQISLSPWDVTTFEREEENLSTPLGRARVVDFTNREQGQKRVIAAIIPFGKGTWFLKMTGREDDLEEHKEIFISFLASLHQPSSAP